MRSITNGRGLYYNQPGDFTIPAYETVAETWARLARRQQQGWPGSISIHGNMIGKPLTRLAQD
jgi:hypothetical protein